MFGDLHIGELLEEVTLMRRALEGIREELAKVNELGGGVVLEMLDKVSND